MEIHSQSTPDGNQYKWIKLPSTGHKETDQMSQQDILLISP